MTALSVIIPALNEGEYLRRTVRRARETAPPGTEIIVIDDGSADGCCDFLRAAPEGVFLLEPGVRLGATGARNAGAAVARGEVLAFLDGHVDMAQDGPPRLAEIAAIPSTGAVGPGIAVMGHPQSCGWGMRFRDASLGIEWLPPPTGDPPRVPLLGGACFFIRRTLFEQAGGFDTGLIRWGSEDAELSLRLWLAGYELRMVPDVIVPHLFRERHPYAIDWATILHNQLRLAYVHFTPARVRRVVDHLKSYAAFPAACALLADSDILMRRAEMRARRSRNDDAYFACFGDIQ